MRWVWAESSPASPLAQRDLWELVTRSAGDLLDYRFESDPVKAVFGFDAQVGILRAPIRPARLRASAITRSAR